MATILDKEKILQESEKIFHRLTGYCETLPDELFFRQPAEKWSIAQNVQHLIISTKTTTAAYALPKLVVRLIGGRPNRPSRSYEELVAKYEKKLAAGGRATGRYIPPRVPPSRGKDRMLDQWQLCTNSYLEAIRKNWATEQFDRYIAPHPLLGKITLRELCYFTIYHTAHHLNIIISRSW